VTGARDGDSQKLSEQMTKAQELRDRLGQLSAEISQIGKQNEGSGQSGAPQRGSGQPGRGGEGGQPGADPAASRNLARLSAEYTRQLEQARDLVDQARREDQSTTPGGGAGFTYEGQQMVLAAPGTEAFKQDFAKWEALRRQATQALEAVEASLSKRIQAKESQDRLAAGVDDKAPAEYQRQVDSYFKALASKKKP
jgi:hypothetical protein